MTETWMPPKASPPQLAYIDALLIERDHPLWPYRTAEELGQAKFGRTLGKREASQAITYLLKLPTATGDAPIDFRSSWPDVPDGRYAVPTDDADHHLAFYRVSHARSGRVYVKVQASDAEHELPYAATGAVLRKIAVEPQEAMLRYGQEIGSCGHCGRTLTDETSRAYGIGPTCRANLGW